MRAPVGGSVPTWFYWGGGGGGGGVETLISVPRGFHEVLRGASTKESTACCWGYHLRLFPACHPVFLNKETMSQRPTNNAARDASEEHQFGLIHRLDVPSSGLILVGTSHRIAPEVRGEGCCVCVCVCVFVAGDLQEFPILTQPVGALDTLFPSKKCALGFGWALAE